MHQLRYLTSKSTGTELRIIEEVQSEWKKLADHLHFPNSFIRNLDHKRDTLDGTCRAVFQHWLDGNGREPKDWHTVKTVLTEMGYKDLVSKLPSVLEEGP